MKKPIITDLKILRTKSELINIDELDSIVKDLEDSLDTRYGIGLSAVQIGILKKVSIVRIKGKEPFTLYNAKIIDKSEPIKFNERCLSLPGLAVLTRRYNQITFINGDGNEYSTEGLESIVIQHELNHQNGKLMLDYKWRKR